MYITKAIEAAKALRPDEYTIDEYLMWCNELSCNLCTNYNKKFSNIVCSDCDEIVLPYGVDIYMIEKIIADDTELRKTDLYDFANRYIYAERGKNVFRMPERAKRVEIIYQLPYTPIRCIEETATVKVVDDTFEMEDIGIYAGDTMIFKKDDESYFVTVISESDNVYTYSGDTLPEGIAQYSIKRKINEKTVCPPPFDYMYIDFLIAKSALYSGDINTYKNHMAAFSLKLDEYSKWISSHKGSREKQWINWY